MNQNESELVTIRGYHRSSKAFYAPILDQIDVMFGHYAIEGGTTGEMMMKWHLLHKTMCAKLECFYDAWPVLSKMPDLLTALGELNGKNITEPEFCALLDSLGFTDLTAYQES